MSENDTEIEQVMAELRAEGLTICEKHRVAHYAADQCPCCERDSLRSQLSAKQAECDELNGLFELQRTRSVEADKRWQDATGKHDCLPDLGELLKWMMGEMDAKQAECERLRQQLAARDNALDQWQACYSQILDAWKAGSNDDVLALVRKIVNDWPSVNSPLHAELASLRQRFSDAEATLSRLPKCWRLDEDGKLVRDVSVVPGMKVYFKAFLKTHITSGIVQALVVEMELADPEVDSWREVATHGMAVCYSSESAARAARERNDAT